MQLICSCVYNNHFAGLTKLMGSMSRSGAHRKALEVYYSLPQIGIAYDTTITNAAISACEKGMLPFNGHANA